MKRHALGLGWLILWVLTFSNESFLAGGQSGATTYAREEVRFEAGHFKVVGDLHLPIPGQRQPAVIIVHGSGPAGRSLSRGPNRVMRSFLEIGFACLIYDKPGYGGSTGEFTPGKLFEERAAILLAAVAALKKHPSINPEQIGLWGISQAGYVMPKAAAATPDIAFMIAVSCPGTDSVEQSGYLVEQQVVCHGYGEAEAKKAGRYYRQRARARTYREYLEAAEFLDQNPVVSSMNWGGILSADRFSPRLPSDELFFDPAPLMEKIRVPVLAIFGENDTQIDPYQGAGAYKKALEKARNSFSRVELFPEADHGILLSKTGCLKDRGSARDYAPGYIELMQEWLRGLRDRWGRPAHPRQSIP